MSPSIGICLDCNYPLHGIPSQHCPECGRAFDPSDPASMNMGSELPPATKWALGPTRRPAVWAALGAVGIAMWAARFPGGWTPVRARMMVVLFAVGLVWLALPVVRAAARRRFGWQEAQLTAGHRSTPWVGVMVIGAALLIPFDIPARFAWHVSKTSMNGVVAQLFARPKSSPDNQWLGLYRARDIHRVPGGVKLTVEVSQAGYRSGFVYLPHVDPKKVGWRAYQYVGDGWWSWREEG